MTCTRWTETSESALERRAASLLRAAQNVRPSAPQPLTSAAGRATRLRRPRAVLGVAAALLTAAAFAASGVGPFTRSGLLDAPSTQPPIFPEVPAPPVPLDELPETAVAAPVPSAEQRGTASPLRPEPASEQARLAPPGADRTRPLQPASETKAPTSILEADSSAQLEVTRGQAEPARSTLGDEAKALASLFEADRTGELAVARERAEAYRARFPHGVLWPEVALAEARVEHAHRHFDAALAALDRVSVEDRKSRPEWLVLRGEVLADDQDCAAAAAPLDEALARLSDGPLAERALATRADCAVSADEPGAQALLTRYLAAWPDGRFAARARDLLSR